VGARRKSLPQGASDVVTPLSVKNSKHPCNNSLFVYCTGFFKWICPIDTECKVIFIEYLNRIPHASNSVLSAYVSSVCPAHSTISPTIVTGRGISHAFITLGLLQLSSIRHLQHLTLTPADTGRAKRCGTYA